MHLNWVQWSTAYSGSLQKLHWKCSGISDTVETCKICREIVCSAVDDCSPVDLQSKIRILCNLFIVNHIVEYLHLLHLKLNKSWSQAILSLHSFYLHFLHSAGSSYYWIYNTNFTCVSLQHPMSNNVVNTIFCCTLCSIQTLAYTVFSLHFCQRGSKSTLARIRTCATKHSKQRFNYLGHPTSYEKKTDFKFNNQQITVGYSQLQYLQVFQCSYYKLTILEI